MGRPRIYEEPRVATAIRIPASLRDDLRAAAIERDVSVNFLVTKAVVDYMGRLASIGDEQRGRRRAGQRTVGKVSS
jgi:hypothetical protein